MYIHEFTVKNYSVHRDTNVILYPITVLVGAHGGGKSALFDALLNFSMVSRGNLRQAFGPWPFSFRATIHRAAAGVARISFRVVMSRSRDDSERLQYEIQYSQIGGTELESIFTIPHERLVKLPENKTLFDRADMEAYAISKTLDIQQDRSLLAAVRIADINRLASSVDPLLLYCSQQISRFNKFRMEPAILGQPSRLPDPNADISPRLGYHGEDLAATLFHLSETQGDALDLICQKVRKIDPAFQNFVFNTIGTDRVGFSAQYSDARGVMPAVRLSSGMLSYIGLITLVSTSNRPPVLMIEEPENGMTPQAIESFYEAARSLATRDNPEERSQILLSSHSPFVICAAWNGEDRDFIYQAKITDGKSLIRKFVDVAEENGIQLRKVKGERTLIGLTQAANLMSGYMS